MLSPLARCVVVNLVWRLGVQVSVFVTYRILSAGTR